MSFIVNNTFFSGNVETSDTSSIKSYNKTYNVTYTKNNICEVLKDVYQENDFVIIDKNVYNLYENILGEIDNKYYFLFDAIEENKNIESVLSIVDILYGLQFNKKNKLIVIGGGITQDVSGFVSAIYKRGLKWVFIPTTLLSMTDSSIGGKVGINRTSKNLLALFVSPNEIIVSVDFLKTLKNEDIVSGLGESLKLALTGGPVFYDYFKENIKTENYENVIKMSTSVKKLIVEKDELETNERRVLNYGHTLGHAIESTSNYFIPHGIAVLLGMLMINRLFYKNKYEEINSYILDLIPEKFKKLTLTYDTFTRHVLNDKKNNGDQICFILLDEIGKSIFVFKRLSEINHDLKNIFDDLFSNKISGASRFFPEKVVEPIEKSLLKDVEIKNISNLISDLEKAPIDELSEIMSKHKSDKGWGLYSEYKKNPGCLPPNSVCHNYTHFYNYLFCNHRNESIQIFEMGVGVPPCMGPGSWAGSLKGWKEYFPNSAIFSADFDKNYLYNEDGIQSFYVDQEDADSIKILWMNDDIKDRTFDLIVDDGPHTHSSNYLFFVNSFNKLKTGGIFIIEDVDLDFIDLLFDEVKVFCENSKIEIEIEKIIIPWPSTFVHPHAKILKMNNLIFVKKI